MVKEATMTIGILVNTDKNLEAVKGITEAALRKGHRVIIFAMDEGTKLLEDKSFTDLSQPEDVEMSFCDHSAQLLGVNTSDTPERIIVGSQFNNSKMVKDSDRVIVL